MVCDTIPSFVSHFYRFVCEGAGASTHAAKEEELKPVKESDPLKESAPLVENKSEDGEGTCTKSTDHYCTRRFGRISQLTFHRNPFLMA
jgi:hypothetical protein